ncbi:uncharacterized protein Z518_09114 [Rhinocladiella mackenziei CBS 650.93]|uniref:Borealin N-terminal domain-containing protein n=1 Tax=Rhinocladiella mackenziei CBS 650.93 TaxID=1442369 RepID=A0A0D2I6F7_9EURO|nr:uncharacterized protein Z518_09114 [Rhinocladiella mackenziei CBS 650.93]KIX01389.1 hypothetical protein Z518_09114 [Rhinocladiella mackenziei CBS 650.93]
MAPANPRKRKSDEMEDPPRATTPTGRSAPKKMRITNSQKQALIDNLQLEITERARQLRAGYALQCADLRARIERRVNRIPISIRKMTMGELMEQHEAAKWTQATPRQSPSKQAVPVDVAVSKERPLPPLPQQETTHPSSPARPRSQPTATRSRKRQSPRIRIAADQENETAEAPDTLPIAKNNNKRGKAAPARAAPRTAKQTSVLSPRSHNSRTLPRSPVKDRAAGSTSPAKSVITRPVSPLKPASPLKTAATAATSAISASVHGMIEHAKRGTASKMTRTASKEKPTTTTTQGPMLPPPRPLPSAPSSPQRAFSQASTHSASTDASTASGRTTVVKPKRGRAAAASAAPKIAEQKSPKTAKRGVAKAANAAKTTLTRNTTTANKKVVVAEPAAGRRVLRKRT